MQILAFTKGLGDWQALVPEAQWKSGYSARTLAHCWAAAKGLPPEITQAVANSEEPLLDHLTPLLAIPEFKVPLPGGRRPSQNDIFVLAKSAPGPVTVMVEGKADEPFGPTVDEWRSEASSGKEKRLAFLLQTLGLLGEVTDDVRYQFLHRAASAIITGEQYRAVAAVMLIHSFSRTRAGWKDYVEFLELFRVEAVLNRMQRLPSASAVPLFAAWVCGDCAFLEK